MVNIRDENLIYLTVIFFFYFFSFFSSYLSSTTTAVLSYQFVIFSLSPLAFVHIHVYLPQTNHPPPPSPRYTFSLERAKRRDDEIIPKMTRKQKKFNRRMKIRKK
jgi:hypothetical protein